tara:strand:- start:979 stop:1404 length:426 start_codon:yes stop_codon:yes gene_type:complete
MAEYIDSLGELILCDSTPDYDGWGSDDYWLATDWITWHKKLKEDCDYTKLEANAIIEQAWTDRGTFGHEWYFQFDTDFRDYFQQEGMNFSSIANIVYTVGKGSEEIVSTAGTLTKILKYAVPALVVGIGIFYGMKAYKELS